MIVGNGLLAKNIKSINNENERVIYFASGVSNSLETKSAEFNREKELLLKYITEFPNHKFIYFSTSSINDPSKKETPYVLHKLEIEKIIQNTTKDYLIFRVGNLIGFGGNHNTLFNFLIKNIKQNKTIHLYKNAKRILLDSEDLPKLITQNRNLHSKTLELAFPYQFSIQEIIECIEKQLKIKAKCQYEEKGNEYQIDLSKNVEFFKGIEPKEYLNQIINKYYISK